MSEKIARKIMTGSAIGNIPVHLSFDEQQHQLTKPDGTKLDIERLGISGHFLGTPSFKQPIFVYVVDQAISLSVELAGSYFWCETLPSATATFDIIKQAGGSTTPLGTVQFANDSVVSVSFTTEQVLVPGDVLVLGTNGDPNGIANLAWSIKANVLPQIITTPLEYFTYTDNGDGTCTVFPNIPDTYEGDIVIPSHMGGLLVTIIGDATEPSTSMVMRTDSDGDSLLDENVDEILPPGPVGTNYWITGAISSYNRVLLISRHVKHIGNWAFKGQRIEQIGFYSRLDAVSLGFDNLYGVIMCEPNESELEILGNYAFENNAITGWLYPPGWFHDVSTNEIFELPPNIKKVGTGAFLNNSLSGRLILPPSLHDTVEGDVITEAAVGNKAFGYNKLTEVHLSPDMYKIPAGAFMANQIKAFGIPHQSTGELSLGKIKEIGTRAFYFNALGSDDENHTLLISGNVVNLGVEAFAFNQLKNVVVDQWEGGLTSLPTGVFRNNEIKNIVLADQITEIGDYAFCHNMLGSGDSQLFAINFAERYERNNLTTIGRFAFADNIWSGLHLPENIVSIGEGAFDYNLISTVTLTNDEQVIAYRDVFCKPHKLSSEWLERVSVHNSTSSIDMSQISCPPIIGLELAGNITNIPVGAFDFTALESYLDLVPIHDLVLSGTQIRTIQANAFRDQSLRSLVVPSTLESIGDNAFADNLIDSLTLNPGIVSIKRGAFERNLIVENALTTGTLTIPTGVIELGEAAFRGNKIANVAFSNTMTTLEAEVFAENKLVSLEIPNYIASIGQGAFRNNLLTSLNLASATSLTTIGDTAFANNQLTSLNIPSTLTAIGEASTQNARVWNETTSMWLAPTEGLVRGAFENNNLTTLSLNNANALIKIGTAAFKGNQLTSIALPANLVVVGDEAFEANNISSLDMTNASSLLVVNWHAFKDNVLSNLNLKCSSFNAFAFSNNPVASVVLSEANAFLMMGEFGQYTSNGSLHAAWLSAVQQIYYQSPSYSPSAPDLWARLYQLNGNVFNENQFGFWNVWQTYLASLEEIGLPLQSNWSIT